MPALVMTSALIFMRPPHSQSSTSILKLRRSKAFHGRYPQRCVGGLSFFAVHVAQSSSAFSSIGGGGGTTRDLHLLAAARTPLYLTVLKRGGCTAVASANPEFPGINDPAGIRKQQLAALRAYAVQARSDATDRPALLIGDLNIDGNDGDAPPSSASEYSGLLALLGLADFSPYDQVNSLFSKRYDLGLYDLFTTAPADLQTAFNLHGELGPGTALGACPSGVANPGKRYDYALILPAPDALPTYAIAKSPTPTARTEDFAPGESLDPKKGTNLFVPVGDECLSDHAALFAEFGLVRIVQPGFWNSSRNHVLTYSVKQVHDLGRIVGGAATLTFSEISEWCGVTLAGLSYTRTLVRLTIRRHR
ncbi:MAG: hypothetical protein IPI67_37215 [Myxococcales bacterium]|nr:hypothetical protein [Myxococcales bacterium]